MASQDKIDIDIFKVVNRAIAESDNLDIMASHLSQLLVGALEIKGCTIFITDPQTKELEVLASFGLSMAYMNKGTLMLDKSIVGDLKNEPMVVADVNTSDKLQYPQQAKDEGISAIISVPITFYGRGIGALRLYHAESWHISDRDLDSLTLLADNIGLAMMYARMINVVHSVKETVNEVHDIWLSP
jgi:signal transduction protein with GAF and PtsI domain